MALAGLAAGCAALHRPAWPPVVETLPQRSEIATVPFFAQEEYQCGPAAMAMALDRSGLRVTPAELTEKVYTASLHGSLQPALVAAARRLGRVAYVISTPDALFREMAAGYPVIVLQNLGLSWVPVWHYAVVIGYDIPADDVLLHSGTGGTPAHRLARVLRHLGPRGRLGAAGAAAGRDAGHGAGGGVRGGSGRGRAGRQPARRRSRATKPPSPAGRGTSRH